jgi:hypothetical protein
VVIGGEIAGRIKSTTGTGAKSETIIFNGFPVGAAVHDQTYLLSVPLDETDPE